MGGLITINKVAHTFGINQILRDISFNVNRGEIVTLIGPNGAGKSTLIKLVLGLEPLQHGTIAKSGKIKIGYMPQKLHLDTILPLTIARFLKLTDSKVSTAAMQQALEQVGLEKALMQQVQQLSGGELQRLLLARALLNQPDLLVLDEPAQGVDVNGQAAMYKLITKIRDQLNCAILLVSHDLHLVMANTDRVICLQQHICCQGQPAAVAADPNFARLFAKTELEALAVYRHHHSHQHDISGDITAIKDKDKQ